MKVCLTLKFIVCGLGCVFPVDIKGQACNECKAWIGTECKACDVGCFLVENYWCHKCQPECYSCSSRNECSLCQTGLYGPRCDYDCASCRDGSCSNKACTDGCAYGYFHHEDNGECLQCPNTCITCNSNSDCTSCLAEYTGPNCQHCKPGYYHQSGKCNQCNTNCLNDTCLDISGNCTDGCKDGWTGLGCIEACGPKCVSCDRHNGTRCTSLDSLQISSIIKGGTQDTKQSVNISVFIGVVGSAVLIILVLAAVLGAIFFRIRRRKLSEYNCVNGEDGNTFGNRDVNRDDNTDGNTDDDVYPVADMTSFVYENVDNTLSAAHSTVPILTPPIEAAEIEDVLYGNSGDVPVIPFVLDVDEVEDIFEQICEGDIEDADAPIVENYYNINGLNRSRVEVGRLRDHVASIPSDDFKKEFIKLPKGLTRPYGDTVKPTNVSKNRYKGIFPSHYTALTLSQRPVYEELNKNDNVDVGDIKGPVYEELNKNDNVDVGDIKAHYTALNPSQGPVYEELDNNDDVDVGDNKAHYTALRPSQGPVYEELNKNDGVGNGDIKAAAASTADTTAV